MSTNLDRTFVVPVNQTVAWGQIARIRWPTWRITFGRSLSTPWRPRAGDPR